jgi:hypothetical protein
MTAERVGLVLYGVLAVLYGLSVWSIHRQARHSGHAQADDTLSRLRTVPRTESFDLERRAS